MEVSSNIFTIAVGDRADTQIAQLAATLQPGQWAELITNFSPAEFSDFLEEPVGSGTSTITWTNKFPWSEADQELRLHATPANPTTPYEFLIYSASSNSWSNGPTQQTGFGHGYDHNCINSQDGISYIRSYNSLRFFRYAKGDSQWTELNAMPGSQSTQVASAIEHFPDRGGFIFLDSVKGLWLYEEATGNWTQIAAASSLTGLGSYHNFAVYSPVHRKVLLGGGNSSNKVWILDQTGPPTPMSDAPTNLHISTGAIITCDPAGGDFIIKQKQANVWWSYNPNSDSYTSFAHPGMNFASTHDVTAGAIQSLGVIAFISYSPGASRMHIYRHS